MHTLVTNNTYFFMFITKTVRGFVRGYYTRIKTYEMCVFFFLFFRYRRGQNTNMRALVCDNFFTNASRSRMIARARYNK